MDEAVEAALRECRSSSEAEQLFTLRHGYRPKQVAERGLNEFSYLYGYFRALAFIAGWESDRIPSALDIRSDAAQKAYKQFRQEIIDGDDHDHRWRL